MCAFVSGHSSFACICGKDAKAWSVETVKRNIERSDLIFIGNLLSSEGDKYSFEVIEVFKGEVASDTIHGEAIEGCSITPYIDGLWIIYDRVEEREGMIDLTFCNLSRSLITLSKGIPPPGIEKADKGVDITWDKDLSVALRDWAQEYAMLVSLKNEQPVAVPQEEITTEEKNASSSGLLTYVAIGLALIALLVALIKK